MQESSTLPTAPAAACDGASSARASAGHGTTAINHQPRPVTRGESPPKVTAHLDWFACTFLPGNMGIPRCKPVEAHPGPSGVSAATLAEIVESVFCIPHSEWEQRAGGWQGYDKRVDLGEFGLLAYGGEHQRGTVHVELNAHGCARVHDWNAVHDWCETYGARLTRVDLAHDDFSGETINLPRARAWLEDGEFTTGGRPPVARLIDDLGSGKGKTLYVGQRQNGKLCRVYEKGKQLGDPQSPWCRVEVELRGKSREIPYDVLLRPSDYLAGSYPCLAYLSERQDKVRTLKKAGEIGYARMVQCLRSQYGPALNAMLRVEGGDPFAVLEQAMRPGTPKRLANLPLPADRSCKGHAR